MKSFTLIELLVVASIIIILSVFLIPNFHLANSRMQLQRSAYRLARDVRKVQEMAMSSRGAFNTPYFPKGGYGLDINSMRSKNSYILFADCDGDTSSNKYDEAGGAVSCSAATEANPYPEMVEEITLEPNVQINFNGTYKLDWILFFPPDPSVSMKPSPNSSPGITLYSTKDDSDKVYYVVTNEAGLIEIKTGYE